MLNDKKFKLFNFKSSILDYSIGCYILIELLKHPMKLKKTALVLFIYIICMHKRVNPHNCTNVQL